MQIAVLNGSPKRGGNTDIMVDAFREGAEEAGNVVDVINLETKKIAPCRVCKYCFTHGGACFIADDMTAVRQSLSHAEARALGASIK